MGFKSSALSTGQGFVDRVLCVVGAVGFSQGPEFMQQYLQRHGGHLDEARRQLQQFQQVAQQAGITLEQLTAKTGANADQAVAKLGAVMTATAERVDQLAAALTAIQHASIFGRPFVFLRHADGGIARATWTVFKPAVPTTAEGAIYALVGMLVLLTFFHVGVKYPIMRAYRRRAMARGVAG